MEVGDKFDGLIDELAKSGKTLDELLSECGELRQLYSVRKRSMPEFRDQFFQCLPLAASDYQQRLLTKKY